VYTTEKAVKEHGDKVDEATRKGIESAIEELKKAMEGDDADAIRKHTEALATASHKLAEVMYQQARVAPPEKIAARRQAASRMTWSMPSSRKSTTRKNKPAPRLKTQRRRLKAQYRL